MITLNQLAKIVHNSVREYALAIGDPYLTWDESPQWQKDSILLGVKFHLTHPFAGPDASHVKWLEHKRAEGWVWGPMKDPEKKEHPCVLPYNQLPEAQKVKDWLFKSIINSIAAEGQVHVVYPD